MPNCKIGRVDVIRMRLFVNGRTFTSSDLSAQFGLSINAARTRLAAWKRAGIAVYHCEDKHSCAKRYRLSIDRQALLKLGRTVKQQDGRRTRHIKPKTKGFAISMNNPFQIR